jgi:hypothetical protein
MLTITEPGAQQLTARLSTRPTSLPENAYPACLGACDAIRRTVRTASAARPHPGRWHPPH